MLLIFPLLLLVFLCLIFVSLINVCLGLFLLGFILYGTLCTSWTWLTISFSMVGKFLTIIASKIFSNPLFFSSSSVVVVQSLSLLQLFATLWTAAHQASLSFTISQNLLKLMSIESGSLWSECWYVYSQTSLRLSSILFIPFSLFCS